MKKSILIIGLVVLSAVLVLQLFSNSSPSPENVDPETFGEKVEEEPGIVIDVRTLEEYEEGHLALTDHHFDFLNGDFEAQLSSLDKEETYYLYCRTGNRSGKAAELMAEQGFENVYNIGGYQDLVDGGAEKKE